MFTITSVPQIVLYFTKSTFLLIYYLLLFNQLRTHMTSQWKKALVEQSVGQDIFITLQILMLSHMFQCFNIRKYWKYSVSIDSSIIYDCRLRGSLKKVGYLSIIPELCHMCLKCFSHEEIVDISQSPGNKTTHRQ